MGLNYSLCAVYRKARAEGMLQDLSEFLDRESRQRIQTLRWAPHKEKIRQTLIGTKDVDGHGIDGLELREHESINHYCFSLLIPLEAELEKQFPDHGFPRFEKAYKFGCMWASVYSGQEYVLLQMTAATTAMSRILGDSRVIQEKWAEFARKSEAVVAYLDLEVQVTKQLFPGFGDLYLPECSTLYFVGKGHFSVDRFVEYIRNVNEV